MHSLISPSIGLPYMQDIDQHNDVELRSIQLIS